MSVLFRGAEFPLLPGTQGHTDTGLPGTGTNRQWALRDRDTRTLAQSRLRAVVGVSQ